MIEATNEAGFNRLSGHVVYRDRGHSISIALSAPASPLGWRDDRQVREASEPAIGRLGM